MKCKEKSYHALVIIILLVMLALNLLSFFKKDSVLKLETIKVGWVENMEAVQKLYKSDSYIAQQTAAIDQALSQLPAEDIVTKLTGNEENMEENLNEENIENDNELVEVNKDMISSLNEIKKSWIIQWDKNARFTILEYSELMCPYCKRQSNQWTIDTVLKKYPNDVNTIFRSFIVHAPAAKLAEGIECVNELDAKKHHDFIKNAFAKNGTLTTDILVGIADDLWINDDDMQKCLDSGKYSDSVSKQTTEGRNLFGVTGTPGNVIIDKETGKFVLIPGAYPPEKFIEEIEKLKK